MATMHVMKYERKQWKIAAYFSINVGRLMFPGDMTLWLFFWLMYLWAKKCIIVERIDPLDRLWQVVNCIKFSLESRQPWLDTFLWNEYLKRSLLIHCLTQLHWKRGELFGLSVVLETYEYEYTRNRRAYIHQRHKHSKIFISENNEVKTTNMCMIFQESRARKTRNSFQFNGYLCSSLKSSRARAEITNRKV